MIQDINIELSLEITTTMIKKFLKLFLIIDFGVIFFCLLQDNMIWLVNTQSAFFSSIVITFGSYLGYKRNIEKRVENAQVDTDQPDSIDKIEDPFDLYSEINEKEELSKEEIKEIILEEKKKLRNPVATLKNTIFSAGGFASLYRIFGYVLLVVAFFYLNNNQLFSAIPFLFGLLIVPLITIIYSFFIKSTSEG